MELWHANFAALRLFNSYGADIALSWELLAEIPLHIFGGIPERKRYTAKRKTTVLCSCPCLWLGVIKGTSVRQHHTTKPFSCADSDVSHGA